MGSNRYQIRVRWDDYRWFYGATDTAKDREDAILLIMERLEGELQDGHIVGSQGEILKTDWRIDGIRYRIICTESTGKKTFDAIETILNLKTKKIKEFTRVQLFNLTRKTIKENG